MLEVQKFLQENSLEELNRQYAIKANRHKQYPHLLSLKYSQLDSPRAHPIVVECRGIILDENNNWAVVSFPYKRFFNYGEVEAVKIDWQTAKVYEKLDGSLMVLYYYDGKWQVQSSGTPDAAGEVNGFNFTFAELFWRVWEELGYQLPQETNYCFMFELLTAYNRIVVKPKKNQIILHGVRNVQTLEESDPSHWTSKYGWELVPFYPLTSWKEVIKAAEYLDPLESEGYIICDGSFNRVKVKSPQYVAISHIRESFSSRKMLEIVRLNEGEEFLSYFPEWTELYYKIKENYLQLVAHIEETYRQYQDIETQKDFAFAIKNLPYSGVLFSLRAGKVSSVKEALRNVTINKIEELLGVDYINLGL